MLTGLVDKVHLCVGEADGCDCGDASSDVSSTSRTRSTADASDVEQIRSEDEPSLINPPCWLKELADGKALPRHTLFERIHSKAWHLMFDFVKFEDGATDVAKSNGSLAVIVGRGVKVLRDVSGPQRCFVARDRFFIEAVSGHVQMMVINTNRKSQITHLFPGSSRAESWLGFGPLKGGWARRSTLALTSALSCVYLTGFFVYLCRGLVSVVHLCGLVGGSNQSKSVWRRE